MEVQNKKYGCDLTKRKYLIKSDFTKDFDKKLETDGWKLIDSGGTKTIDYNNKFRVYVKEVNLIDVVELSESTTEIKSEMTEAEKISVTACPEKPDISTISATPPNSLWDDCDTEGVTLNVTNSLSPINPLNEFYMSYPFINEFRNNSNHNDLIIRADYCYLHKDNNILSYSLSCIINNKLITMIIFTLDNHKLNLNIILGRFFDYINYIPRYNRKSITKYKCITKLNDKLKPVEEVFNTKSEAKSNAVYAYSINNKPTTNKIKDLKSLDSDFKSCVVFYDIDTHPSITLLLSFGLGFLSSLDVDNKYSINLISIFTYYNLINHNNHLFSTISNTLNCSSCINRGYDYIYNFKLNIRDVGCYSSDYSNSTISYFNAAHCKSNYKIEDLSFVDYLNEYILKYPVNFMRFCWMHSVGPLVYTSRIFGINKPLPCTLISEACNIAKNHIMCEFGYKSNREYLSKYSGFKKLTESEKSDGGYHNQQSLVSLNSDCNLLHFLSAQSYRGGFNICLSVDVHHNKETYDVDLCSAYPTAMNLIPLVDWSNPIESYIKNRYLTLDDFKNDDGTLNPLTPIFASVTYDFSSSDSLYPNLPRNKEDDTYAPCYPITETNPVYCSGPELYTALKMGAKIFVVDGVKARYARDEHGDLMYPYRMIVKQLVDSRTDAAKNYGKKSFEAMLLKLTINSLYGKSSQGVKSMFNHSDNKKMHESAITNTVSASLITSLIRSVLFASLHDINECGYESFSVTTDGLITTIPIEKLDELPLFGLTDLLKESRQFITGETNPSVWEVKHIQQDLLNLTTRANASLNDSSESPLPGVIAKGGVAVANPVLPKESYENRLAFIKQAISRTGPIPTPNKTYTKLSDIEKGEPYYPTINYSGIRLDFDMKRKPLEETLTRDCVTVDGETFEVATIKTVPFKDSDEYLIYKTVAKNSTNCIRTFDEWKMFFVKLNNHSKIGSVSSMQEKNEKWKQFKDCICAYKMGLVSIPSLDNPNLTVNDKVKYLQEINPCDNHTFTKKIWDKTSEKKVQDKIYDVDTLTDMVDYINSSLNSI